MQSKRIATELAFVVVLGLVATACKTERRDISGSVPGPSGGQPAANPLMRACGDKIVIQADWFPEPSQGMMYQLIGPGGRRDEKGYYTGEIRGAGVTAEIRSGGPFTGYQQVTSQMYEDQSILLGMINLDEAVLNSADLPVVGVVAPMEKSPQILMWSADEYDFKSFADIGKEWGRPIRYLMIHDSGYENYAEMSVVRPEVIKEKRSCLELLVPMIQRAQVDYIRTPRPVNDELLAYVSEMGGLWSHAPSSASGRLSR